MKKFLIALMVATIMSTPIAIILYSFFYLPTWIFVSEAVFLVFVVVFWKTYSDLKREDKNAN